MSKRFKASKAFQSPRSSEIHIKNMPSSESDQGKQRSPGISSKLTGLRGLTGLTGLTWQGIEGHRLPQVLSNWWIPALQVSNRSKMFQVQLDIFIHIHTYSTCELLKGNEYKLVRIEAQRRELAYTGSVLRCLDGAALAMDAILRIDLQLHAAICFIWNVP